MHPVYLVCMTPFAPADDVPARTFRNDISDQLDRVQHGGERLRITRNGKPAAAVVPVGDLADFDAFRATERGLSHVGDGTGQPLTRDQLAARLRGQSNQFQIDEGVVRLRAVDVEVIATLLGELVAARTDALATLADEWAVRLRADVYDARP